MARHRSSIVLLFIFVTLIALVFVFLALIAPLPAVAQSTLKRTGNLATLDACSARQEN
jgi:hypothetical protein